MGQSAAGQPQQQLGTSQQPFFRSTSSYPANPSHTLATPYHPAQEDAFDQRQSQGQAQDLDDALFEKHFAAAALEVDQAMGQAEANLQPMNGEILENAQSDQAFDNTTLLGPSIQRDIRSEPVIDAGIHDPIGSDRILSESKGKGKEQEVPDDADELARTAGHLLENVKHDQSQKFKQSNFLSLMRQLRDREVRVEGDKLVDVSMPTLSS